MSDSTSLRPEDFLPPRWSADDVALFDDTTSFDRAPHGAGLPHIGLVSRGPYRHAWAHGGPSPWSLGDLDRLSREMLSQHDEESANDPALDPDCRLPAGYTYFGQFLIHDLSRMSSRDGMRSAVPLVREHSTGNFVPNRVVNDRSPRLDLDSLYGRGPLSHAELFERASPRSEARERGAFHIGGRAQAVRMAPHEAKRLALLDLQRTLHGKPVIPDHRNDENVMLSQVHLGLQLAHNACMSTCRSSDERTRFAESRRLMRWHVQWLALNDLLRQLMHTTVVRWLDQQLDALRLGTRTPTRLERAWNKAAWLPLEFVLAGFRFGHALARSHYRLNHTTPRGIRLMPAGPETPASRHLAGGHDLRRGWTLHWDYFFGDGASPHLQRARLIRPEINASLGALPAEPLREAPPQGSMAAAFQRLSFLTLLHGELYSLPTGQQLARAFQTRMRSVDVYDPSDSTPLWSYLLAEAARAEESAGLRLGRLGSWIVAETLLGLIVADKESYLRREPSWEPPKHRSVHALLRSGWPAELGGDAD